MNIAIGGLSEDEGHSPRVDKFKRRLDEFRKLNDFLRNQQIQKSRLR